MSQMSYLKAANRALDEELARDERVFLFGEDIGIFGGCFGLTGGLYDKYGKDRVIDTPISENIIAASAFGAALYGMRPVAEIMFADFLAYCYDTLMNMAPQTRYLSGGQATVPLVIRSSQGIGAFTGGHHCQDATVWALSAPGITIVCPTTADETYALLKASIRSDNFVLFLEHKKLYGTRCEVPDGEHLMEIGKAKVVKEGIDITIIANQLMRVEAEEAIKTLEQEGISVELIDPLTIKPYDRETMIASVNKTGRALICTEAHKTGSYAGEFGIELGEVCFNNLKKPVTRLCSMDLPYAKSVAETYIVPNAQDIIASVRQLMK